MSTVTAPHAEATHAVQLVRTPPGRSRLTLRKSGTRLPARCVVHHHEDDNVSGVTSSVSVKQSPPFDWASLGLVDEQGQPVPCPGDGPYRLVYWSPWCGDCQVQWAALHERALAREGRAAFVGCFASQAELSAWTAEHPIAVPSWREPGLKSESDRVRTFHAFLRQLTGDTRRWGVPVLRELEIRDGRFVLRWM